MVKIGIIGAMDEEIRLLVDSFEKIQEIQWNEFTFYSGILFGKEVVIIRSGVGKVFSAMICQYLIDKFNIDYVLFSGVGGALNSDLQIGDVLLGVDAVHHDLDVRPLGFKIGEIPYTKYRFFSSDTHLLELAQQAELSDNKIVKGRILTGDQFFTHTELMDRSFLIDELKGDCIEMEGAAVAQVCTVNKIPSLIIRTITDKADGTAADDFNAFKEIVAKNSFNVIEKILEGI
jgi:adenosylhomocysteine nucleosidase